MFFYFCLNDIIRFNKKRNSSKNLLNQKSNINKTWKKFRRKMKKARNKFKKDTNKKSLNMRTIYRNQMMNQKRKTKQ